LLLAVVGIYGTTSYSMNRRRGEIGIRMALGATPGLVVRQLLSPLLMRVGIGLLIGGGISLWVSQFGAALLYGLRPRDPFTLVGATIILAATSAIAGWLPAWRAARVDPMTTLRCE
jgi:putative ABC transport system permease protein